MEIWKNVAAFSWALLLQSQTRHNEVLSSYKTLYVLHSIWPHGPRGAWRKSIEQNAELEIGLRTLLGALALPPSPSLSLSLVFPTIVVHQVNEASQKLIRSINPFQRFSSLSARHAPLPDSTLGGKGLATFGDIPDARWCSYSMLANMFLLI